MHPCQYFTHLWHFAFDLVLGDSNFNNMLFQCFFVFFGTPCIAVQPSNSQKNVCTNSFEQCVNDSAGIMQAYVN